VPNDTASREKYEIGKGRNSETLSLFPLLFEIGIDKRTLVRDKLCYAQSQCLLVHQHCWSIREKALETLEENSAAQVFIIKFAHDHHLSTRRHMHRIKRAKTDKCPVCKHMVETDWHVLSCPKRSLWCEELLCAFR
jgi:hypothetical protein